jgi:cellulose synthase/poly-beta-1,6-N-acetylglucosamine synthase-like glycosyltransferase/peptidoglycan/xylan/chitin deacetylase (PgdA/CDA1 family)
MRGSAGDPLPLVPTGDRPVFLNPSGMRWKYLRRLSWALLAVLVGGAAVVVPRVVAPPALNGAAVPEGLSVTEVGRPPVVGEGPLVQVLRLTRSGGQAYGEDPFDGQVKAQLSSQDADRAGDAAYVLHRYGYSATAHRTITLTFDDGPDPVYTPKLLDLLSAHGVPATFFVTGEQMVKYPEIMRRIVREGFSLGNHSLTHVDVSTTTPFREQLELALADRIMRAQTGQYSSVFRLPYESNAENSMQDDVQGILRAQQFGYVVASHDFDTRDWAYAAGLETGTIPMPPLGEQDNITMLLHDSGGADRTLTLEYVEELIGAARAAGYTFHSMPQVQPAVADRTGVAEVTAWDGVALRVGQVLFVVPGTLLHGLFVLALVSMLGVGLFQAVLAVLRRRRTGRRAVGSAPGTAGVSVLIAAYNEELVITRTLEYVLASAHPVSEVIVVDDGSTDGTAAMVRDVAARDPRVRLVQQRNAGKWAALNRGFAEVTQPLTVTLDADTLFTRTTIGELVAGFHSPRVGAVAGVIRVGNYSRNVVTRWQALEYLTQIGLERGAAAYLDAIAVIPGACAAWRTDAVRQAGGYSGATLAEDCDLTLMLHQYGWRVEQADHAIAYTEAPETLDALLRQRVRWMYGTLQATWRHRNMILRPRYGWLGMFVLPLNVLTVLVPLVFTPFITLVVLRMLTEQGPLRVLLYFALFTLVYGVLSAVAVWLMRERPGHLLMVPLYRLIYEPLRAYLLYASLGRALRGAGVGWNKLKRTAHMDDVPAPAVAVRA